MGGKQQETERDAGVMQGRQAGEKFETLHFLMTF